MRKAHAGVSRALLPLLLIGLCAGTAEASGHGPVFGAATPTLGKGGWSFDQAWMGRHGTGSGESDQMLRSMISFGLTEDLQISGSLPIALRSGNHMPMGRMTSLMSAGTELEVLTGWRFHRRPAGDGARIESTAYAGVTAPLESHRAGIRTAPSVYGSIASGYASRAHYFWIGGGYQRYADDAGDRAGDITSYSVVYGYRPRALRLDYPRPDLRFFVEAVGEITDAARHGGTVMPDTGGHVVMIGPTALLLYKAYGIEGGVQFPAYQRTNGSQPRERFRFGLNVSYFFWLK